MGGRKSQSFSFHSNSNFFFLLTFFCENSHFIFPSSLRLFSFLWFFTWVSRGKRFFDFIFHYYRLEGNGF